MASAHTMAAEMADRWWRRNDFGWARRGQCRTQWRRAPRGRQRVWRGHAKGVLCCCLVHQTTLWRGGGWRCPCKWRRHSRRCVQQRGRSRCGDPAARRRAAHERRGPGPSCGAALQCCRMQRSGRLRSMLLRRIAETECDVDVEGGVALEFEDGVRRAELVDVGDVAVVEPHMPSGALSLGGRCAVTFVTYMRMESEALEAQRSAA